MSLEMPRSLNSPTLRLHWQSQTALSGGLQNQSQWHTSRSQSSSWRPLYINYSIFLLTNHPVAAGVVASEPVDPHRHWKHAFRYFFTKTGKKPESDRTHSWGRIHDELKRSRWVLPRGEFWWWEGWRWVCTLASPPPSFQKWFAKIFAFKEDAEELRWRMRSLTGHCHWVCISVMKSGWLSWHFNTGDPAGSGRRTWWQ